VAFARLAEWSVLKLGGFDPTAVSWRLPEGLHLDQTLLLGGAPQYWTRVLQLIADAPGEHGSGTRASDVGAVMKVRAGLFHTPAEPRRGRLPCNICGAQWADALHALREHWHGIGDSATQLVPDDAHAGEIMEQLREMGHAVPAWRRTSACHAALMAASCVIGDLRQGEQPQEEAWESARAVIAGILPPHSGRSSRSCINSELQ
jgi:hypothetical protein